ncbi:MAG: Asp23/Gls24 family envelope stress response protein [Ruminococcaceae bacterium]|nr:Asp23/Gls24 family envelope stress response protein [Oscillospiraceae bacterium]
MSENTTYTETGAVKISDEVVQTIAGMAAREVKGVALATSIADGLVEKIVKKGFSKGVKIDMAEKEVSLDVHILVDYGVKIQAVSAELQDIIKRNIETMTDLIVNTINVYVDGINFSKEPKKTASVEDTEE